jgi:hypothetical protein
MKTFAVKAVKALVAIALLVGIGFVGGALSQPAKVDVSTVAYENTPGPYGSGVLGDWSGLSHGLYCYQPPGSGFKFSQNTTATKATYKSLATTFSCPGEDIRVYGDSILNGGKVDLALDLYAYGKTVYVDSWAGRPTTPVADAICAETVFPPVVVVASGTNDIFNPTVMATQINRIKACIPATTKLFWVDVQATRWGQTEYTERNDQRNSMAVNLAIYQNLNKNQIIQWTQRFMSTPSLLGNYLVDGVHPKSTPLNSNGRPVGYDYWSAIVTGWMHTLGAI